MSVRLVFEPIQVQPNEDAFTGAFLSQQSYVSLLKQIDSNFSLGMLTDKRVLPCERHSYMLLNKKEKQRWVNIGRNVRIKVHKLLYNRKHGVAVALIHMKNNFTCNRIPHIVLAKKNSINRATVREILQSADNDVVN